MSLFRKAAKPGAPGANPDASSVSPVEVEARYRDTLERAEAERHTILVRVQDLFVGWCRDQAAEAAVGILENTASYLYPLPDFKAFKGEVNALQNRMGSLTHDAFAIPKLWGHLSESTTVQYSVTPWPERTAGESNVLEPAWCLLIQIVGDELDALFEKYQIRDRETGDFVRGTRLMGGDFVADETIRRSLNRYRELVAELGGLRVHVQHLDEAESRRKALEIWESL